MLSSLHYQIEFCDYTYTKAYIPPRNPTNMKRILILLVILFVACQPTCNPPYILNGNACCLDENSNRICDSDEPVQEVEFTELIEEQIEAPIVVEPVKESLPIDIMLKKSEERLKSYTFITPYAKFDGANFYVKGDMVRVDLHDALTLVPGEYVDLLVFNKSDKSVKGYCRRLEHVCKDSLAREFNLEWDDLWDPLPTDLIKKFAGDKAESFKEEGEIVDDRLVTVFVFKGPLKTTTFWVDAHYGVPLRIREQSGKNDRVFSFESMAFNNVKDEVFEAFNVRPKKN